MDGLAVLTRVGSHIQTVDFAQFLPLSLSLSPWMPAGMESAVVCGPTRDAATAVSDPAALTADIWEMPAAA